MTGRVRGRERQWEIRGREFSRRTHWQTYLVALVVLVIIWIFLWGSINPVLIGIGVVCSAIVLFVFPLPSLEFRVGVHPGKAAVLIGRFLVDMVVASVHIAWLAIRPRLPRTEVTTVQLTTDSDLVQALTALAVSLVPGSLIIEADPEERTLLIHVLDADQATMDEFANKVRAQERRIVEAFGTDDPQAPGPVLDRVGVRDRAARRGSSPMTRRRKGGPRR
ncbi:Na+/H+ antiporter subunit E [Nakamurella flavida]|uniref:Na+/H+ antiporter subunit E n=1 Tax=Nakamurella flavida TaxID=363630 RepID=A0A939C4Q4_9ACTN|nr:Na+/H+ antiporter subunit E [Nakamurella flavida]MBM9478336.1 Na+/H+ antiporter subunit E [Nakamurella flavida]MDP9777492.1 multicomponent Na+:H+ antiporter subunit E [Nakamurella flavida]